MTIHDTLQQAIANCRFRIWTLDTVDEESDELVERVHEGRIHVDVVVWEDAVLLLVLVLDDGRRIVLDPARDRMELLNNGEMYG